MHEVEHLIVGAGLGGLHAAALLAANGSECRVLEARSRAGGRILSPAHPSDASVGLDLGPTWFWPHQTHMRQLAETLALEVFEQPEDGDVLYQMETGALQRASGPAPPSFRLRGGMMAMITALVQRLPTQAFQPGMPVTHIERDTEGWRVSVNGAQVPTHRARHLLAAVPPRVFVRIPGVRELLSGSLFRALADTATWMAGHAKFVAAYDRPFWRDGGLAGTAFSRSGPMVEVHDAGAAGNGAGALFGFVGLPPANRESAGEASIMQACTGQLAGLFGPAAGAPLAVFYQDWATEVETAVDTDRAAGGTHPALALAPHAHELDALGLALPVSEASPAEAGYLEGALIASALVVSRLVEGQPSR